MSQPAHRGSGHAVALTGASLFLPGSEAQPGTLIIREGLIEALLPPGEQPAGAEVLDLSGQLIAPGFIDLQVNGGGGVLFNDHPSPEAIDTMFRAHARFGTTAFLPTLISDTPEKMHAAIAAVRDARRRAADSVLGLHLEGPFLASPKRGIHDDRHFRALDEDWIEQLSSADAGKLLVTLAPERTDVASIRRLSDAGILVSAGHTAADYQQTVDALGSGLRGFTHLFNAMPPLLSRAPGPVGAALESEAWCMLIADGHHVDDAVLRLVHRAKADGRVILVTDAMATVGTDATSFTLGDRTIRVGDGRCTGEDGTLAGSALTMLGAVRHMHLSAGLPLHEAVRMASEEPARFLRLEHERGTLKPGLRADLAVLDPALLTARTVVGGDLRALLSPGKLAQ